MFGGARIATAALFLLVGCGPYQQEAMRLLSDLKAGHGPSALKQSTPRPTRREVRYDDAGRDFVADLWRPGAGWSAKAGVVLVPGAAPEGRDDTRLTAFAATLSRGGFQVLVPEIPNPRRLHVAASDAKYIAAAIRHLSETAPRRPVAVVAISYSVGPAIIALAGPGMAERVDFLLAIGGYHDIENVVAYFTTGRYRDRSGRDRPGAPDPRAKWVFLRANAERVGDAADGALLREIAIRRLRRPAVPQPDLARRLGPNGRAVLNLVTNRDPKAARSLIAALPEELRRSLRALDLSGQALATIEADALFLHGAEDPIIPASESEVLAAAWTPGRARLLLLDGVRHVNAGGLTLGDTMALIDEVALILRRRDAGPR